MSYSKSTGVQKVLRRLHRFVFQSVPNTAPPEVDLSRLPRVIRAEPVQELVPELLPVGFRRSVHDFSGHVKT
jgi:hypothetical protein